MLVSVAVCLILANLVAGYQIGWKNSAMGVRLGSNLDLIASIEIADTYVRDICVDMPGFSSTPTRTKPKRKTGVEKDTKKKEKTDKDKGFVIKESRSIADEIEAYFAEDNYMVILYNDPFNKRAYVSAVLQDTFKWDEMQADAVMLQAHTNGFAVTVETSEERAMEYVEKLLAKGLIAEARKSGDTGGEEGDE